MNQNQASPSDSEKTPRKGDKKVLSVLLRFFQGMLIGVGGILPGISGGVMCAIFGLYQPIMEFLAHPIRNFRKHFLFLLPAGIGLVIGFLGLARLVESFFSANEAIAVAVFMGLILGMMPSLWQEAGKNGRDKSCFGVMGLAFAVIFGIFLFLELGAKITVAPNFLWFLASGIFFGLGIVVPGMSASSPLLFLGLMEPLLAVAGSFMDSAVGWLKGDMGFGAALSAMRFDAAVPFILGVVAVFVGLSRLVSRLIDTQYARFYHGIFGVVAATVLPVLIFRMDFAKELPLKLLCIAGGFVAALLLDRLNRRLSEE